MYPFIKKEYSCKEGIMMLEHVSLDELSYPVESYNVLFSIEEQSFWFQHRNRCIEKMMQVYPSKSFVDVGGGNGFVTWYLQEQGYDITLLEPSIQACQNAKFRGVKKIICGLFKEEYIRENSVEGICLFDVLEHIKDDKTFLEVIHSKMQTNGRIYLTVPASKKLWSKEDEEAGHFRRYEKEELDKMLEEAGFQIEYSTYFFSFLYIPVWLIRKIGGGIRNKQMQLSKQNSILTKEHKTYYIKFKKIVDYLEKSEMRKIANKTIKTGTSLLIVAKAN